MADYVTLAAMNFSPTSHTITMYENGELVLDGFEWMSRSAAKMTVAHNRIRVSSDLADRENTIVMTQGRFWFDSMIDVIGFRVTVGSGPDLFFCGMFVLMSDSWCCVTVTVPETHSGIDMRHGIERACFDEIKLSGMLRNNDRNNVSRYCNRALAQSPNTLSWGD